MLNDSDSVVTNDQYIVSLNIFYSKEKDWVWHKARHYPLQHQCIVPTDNTVKARLFGCLFVCLLFGGVGWGRKRLFKGYFVSIETVHNVLVHALLCGN